MLLLPLNNFRYLCIQRVPEFSVRLIRRSRVDIILHAVFPAYEFLETIGEPAYGHQLALGDGKQSGGQESPGDFSHDKHEQSVQRVSARDQPQAHELERQHQHDGDQEQRHTNRGAARGDEVFQFAYQLVSFKESRYGFEHRPERLFDDDHREQQKREQLFKQNELPFHVKPIAYAQQAAYNGT